MKNYPSKPFEKSFDSKHDSKFENYKLWLFDMFHELNLLCYTSRLKPEERGWISTHETRIMSYIDSLLNSRHRVKVKVVKKKKK